MTIPNLITRIEINMCQLQETTAFFTHEMSPDLKKILFSLIKPHVDIKRKNKNFELLPKGKMADEGKEVINSTRKLIR